MLSQAFGEDQDVVKVDRHLAFGDEVMEDVVHHPLERGRGVCEPKEHDGGFEEASVCVEGSLFFIPFSDSDIVVSPTDIELREVFGAVKFVDKFRDEGERVSVLDCHLVQFAIVLDWAQSAILFLSKEERRSKGRLRGTNMSGLQVFIEELVELFLFVSVQGVDFTV